MENAIKVGVLKGQLSNIPDDWDLTFGGVLDFYRIKQRGKQHIDIEFNQIIDRNKDGRVVLADPVADG